MDLPKFHQTFIPILEILDKENELNYKELKIKVRDKYYSHLPKDLLNKTTPKGKVNTLLNRIGWGIMYLKNAKLVIYPERGCVKITDKGKLVVKKGNFTLQELKADKDYIEYQKKVELKRVSQDEQKQKKDIELEDETPSDLIEQGISSIEQQVKAELLERLKEIDPYYFERIVLILLNKMGYGEFIETSKSNDGGIDGVINEDLLGLEKIYIQAKRYSENKVREKDIRNFIGAMSGDTQKGVFITTSEFDKGAVKKAHDAHHTIILIDGSQLVSLMYQFNIGIQIKTTYEIKELDNDFFEME